MAQGDGTKTFAMGLVRRLRPLRRTQMLAAGVWQFPAERVIPPTEHRQETRPSGHRGVPGPRLGSIGGPRLAVGSRCAVRPAQLTPEDRPGCVFLRRSRTPERTLTEERWFLSGCYRKATRPKHSSCNYPLDT